MPTYDLVIRNGRVLDGTGNPWFAADVAVADGRIAAVGRRRRWSGDRDVDAAGRMVCPGFIDIHTHADIANLRDPRLEPVVMQGVTTNVFANCGLGFAPVTDEGMRLLRERYASVFGPTEGVDFAWRSVEELLARYEGRTCINVAYLVPHAALRASVVGMQRRPAAADELNRMRAMLQEGLEHGAFGFTTGLWYAPLDTADETELVELCEATARHGGILTIHMRDYRARMDDSVRESLRIAGQAGLPLEISHFQLPDRGQGRSAEMLALVDEARAHGQDVTLDSYPYCAGSTTLAAFLPAWVAEGGTDAALGRLADPEDRPRIVAELAASDYRWQQTVIAAVAAEANREIEGRDVVTVARQRGLSPEEAICDLLIEERLQVVVVYHGTVEEDVQRVMRHPAHMVGSDGLHVARKPHPRLYGTFPRYLARYVRELGVLTLQEAVRKMTSLPAARLGLMDRGLVRPGMAADLVVFDPDTIQDRATFEDPCRHPDGIAAVVINGQVVAADGRHTGALPGQVLRSV